ncbi:UDP-3-O-acyl-N-acetylglucosamine deacetylase [Thermodesulfobium acidiphilum]
MFEGIGIHTGKTCKVMVYPSNGGLWIKKGDMLFSNLHDMIVPSENATVLENDYLRLSTVEHLLCALAMLNVNDAVIEILDGEEVPILDGSAIKFYKDLSDIFSKKYKKNILRSIKQPIFYIEDESFVYMFPYKRFEVRVYLDYTSKGLGLLSDEFILGRDKRESILNARTFGFLSDYELLKSKGKALGANFDNVLVFDNKGRSLKKMRSLKEVQRHKILDFIGDLYLNGFLPRAQIVAVKPGHKINAKVSKMINSFV